MDKEKKSFFRCKIFNIFLFLLFSLFLLFLYAKNLGVKGLVVKEYRVESNILTKNFDGLKIVHFSDLLYGSSINEKEIKDLIHKINILNPDIVVFTGDLVSETYKINNNDKKILVDNLLLISSNIGKYAVFGDNDFSLDVYNEILTNSNFTVLNNSYEEVFYKTNESLYLVGIPSSIKSKPDIDKSFEFYNDENRKYTIVLVHDGNTIKYIDNSNYEVDLILGGHSLNGSVKLPFIGPIFKDNYFYKYYDEAYEKSITKIFISGGLGTNNLNLRINNKPSFNLYRLKAQS